MTPTIYRHTAMTGQRLVVMIPRELLPVILSNNRREVPTMPYY